MHSALQSLIQKIFLEQILWAASYSRHMDMEARRQSPAPHGDQLYVEILKSGIEGLPWWLGGLGSVLHYRRHRRVQTLVRELRSHMPQSKKINNSNNSKKKTQSPSPHRPHSLYNHGYTRLAAGIRADRAGSGMPQR